MARHSTGHGTAPDGMAQRQTAWHGVARCGTVWHGTALHSCTRRENPGARHGTAPQVATKADTASALRLLPAAAPLRRPGQSVQPTSPPGAAPEARREARTTPATRGSNFSPWPGDAAAPRSLPPLLRSLHSRSQFLRCRSGQQWS